MNKKGYHYIDKGPNESINQGTKAMSQENLEMKLNDEDKTNFEDEDT